MFLRPISNSPNLENHKVNGTAFCHDFVLALNVNVTIVTGKKDRQELTGCEKIIAWVFCKHHFTKPKTCHIVAIYLPKTKDCLVLRCLKI